MNTNEMTNNFHSLRSALEEQRQIRAKILAKSQKLIEDAKRFQVELAIELKKVEELKRKSLEIIELAKFLTHGHSIDEMIDQIPMLIAMQEIAELTQDFVYAPDCRDNVVVRLDWDISNRDIRDANRYMNMAFQNRINFEE